MIISELYLQMLRYRSLQMTNDFKTPVQLFLIMKMGVIVYEEKANSYCIKYFVSAFSSVECMWRK